MATDVAASAMGFYASALRSTEEIENDIIDTEKKLTKVREALAAATKKLKEEEDKRTPPQELPDLPTEIVKPPTLIFPKFIEQEEALRKKAAEREKERQAKLVRIRQEAQAAITRFEREGARSRTAIVLQEFEEKKRLLKELEASKATSLLVTKQFKAQLAAAELEQFTAQHQAKMDLVQQATDFAVAAALSESTTRESLGLRTLAFIVRTVGEIAAQYLRQLAANELKNAAIASSNALVTTKGLGEVAVLSGAWAAFATAMALLPGAQGFIPAAVALGAVAGATAGTAVAVEKASQTAVRASLIKAAVFGVAAIAVQAAAEIAAQLLEKKASEKEGALSFQKGGFVPPGRHRAILHGPEFVNTPAQLAALLSSAGGNITVNATFTGPISSQVDIDRAFEQIGFSLERGRRRALAVA